MSVAIIAYSSARTVGGAVKGALAQALSAVDVVVMDDDSTDHALQRLMPFNGRNCLFRRPKRGIASNRNATCAHALGEFDSLRRRRERNVIAPGAVPRLHGSMRHDGASASALRTPPRILLPCAITRAMRNARRAMDA